jgi:hypothetical protein
MLLALLALIVGGGTWLAENYGTAAGPKRVIYMSAVEYKGGTSTEPFPSATPPPGGGYLLKPPDSTGRWETSTYRWEPGTILVNQGDEVELRIWGVNGAEHPSYVENYIADFTVTRGNLTVLNFTADKAGSFRIHCNAHQPSMETLLVVMPQSAVTPTPSGQASPTPAPAQLPSTGSGDGSGNLWQYGFLAGFILIGATGVALIARKRFL